MAKDRKTPGVYIEEINAFPNSVVPIATAVPAFIGYTQMAMKKNIPVGKKPTKISSLMDFEDWFGTGFDTQYDLAELDAALPMTDADLIVYDEVKQMNVGYTLKMAATSKRFFLYDSIRLFYDNGGGDAYIVSMGDYGSSIASSDLEDGIALLLEETEPTMVVIPDTMGLPLSTDCTTVQKKMIDHCKQMQSRVAVLDIFEGYLKEDAAGESVIETFRTNLVITQAEGSNYAAAYYPWINTNITSLQNIYFNRIDTATIAVLQALLTNSLSNDAARLKLKPVIDQLATPPTEEAAIQALNSQLTTLIPAYTDVISALGDKINLQPTAGAMAGIYAKVDNITGVWKAPANIGITSLLSPSVLITSEQQEDLNVPIDGKAVNAIRTLPGRGTLVWGARTLDGNSQDWRYINVRRTMIFLEQSIKAAAEAFVFEPNTTTTWISVRAMIVNFLTNQWSQGALMGNKPAEAFSVAVGLGQTMTANDVLDGYMKVMVKVAPVRPAEFIVITFQQQMIGA